MPSGNNRVIVTGVVQVNTTAVTGSECSVYSRNMLNGDYTAVGSCIAVLSANDVVRVRTKRKNDSDITTSGSSWQRLVCQCSVLAVLDRRPNRRNRCAGPNRCSTKRAICYFYTLLQDNGKHQHHNRRQVTVPWCVQCRQHHHHLQQHIRPDHHARLKRDPSRGWHHKHWQPNPNQKGFGHHLLRTFQRICCYWNDRLMPIHQALITRINPTGRCRQSSSLLKLVRLGQTLSRVQQLVQQQILTVNVTSNDLFVLVYQGEGGGAGGTFYAEIQGQSVTTAVSNTTQRAEREWQFTTVKGQKYGKCRHTQAQIFGNSEVIGPRCRATDL